jgi:hypothetical protein
MFVVFVGKKVEVEAEILRSVGSWPRSMTIEI